MIKNNLTATLIFLAVNVTSAFSQAGIFDPNDAVVNYNPASPPVTPPANTLAKWVRTPGLNWNTDNFKAYYYNDMAFRVRFPNGYNPADLNKKYPVILFLHGGGEVAPVTDNEMQLRNGAELFQGMIDAGQFNAFMVFPQEIGFGWDYSYLTRINNVMDSLEKYCHTDPDRVIAMGLSAGAFGVISYAIAFPQRISSTIAASPALISLLTQDPSGFVQIPFWIASGGIDVNPNPTEIQNFVDNFTNKGGNVRYSFYPTLAHNTWDRQWQEPYLLPAWNAAHKANPLVYFNRTKFISASAINARIGISPGFYQYQWQKDNVVLPGAVSNEIQPNQFGSYTVRFKRFSYSDWSDWSPIPAVLSQDNIAPTVPLNVKSLYAGRTFVNLDWDDASDNDLVNHYDIYVNGIKKYTTSESAITADQLSPGVSYTFTVRALDQAGNVSNFSTPITVNTTKVTNGLNYRYYQGNWTVLPDFNALTPVKTGVSPNATINPGTQGVTNLFGYVWEGYINITTPGTYTFETNSSDGSKLYFNSFYSPLTKALVNNDGVHEPWAKSATVSVATPGLYPIAVTYFDQWNAQTLEIYWTGPGFNRSLVPDSVFLDPAVDVNDKIPPTAPANLKVVSAGASILGLTWDKSTDNISVAAYDIYINNIKRYSCNTSDFIATNLTPNTSYSITIKAIDKAGNESAFSTPVSGSTSASPSVGLKYRYYQGQWSVLPDFNSLSPVKTGSSPNVDISVRDYGVNQNFAFVWEGNINISTPGTYTFETVSDDGSKLYFNSFYSPMATPLANNDGVHGSQSATGSITIPNAGQYPIAITYFQKDGGENMQVYWTGPGIARQLIPNTAFAETVSADGTPPTVPANLRSFNTGNTFITLKWDNSTDNSGVAGYDIYVNNVKKYTSAVSGITADNLLPNTTYTFAVKAFDYSGDASGLSNVISVTTAAASSGLQYRYYEGNWNTLPNFDSLTPVKWGSTPNVDIVTPANVSNFLGFVWEGYIKIPVAGTYTFETVSDDGSRLFFNSFYSPKATALVNNDGLHGATSAIGTVTLAAGAYPISIIFFQKDGGQSMQVYWTGPGIPRQLIPNAAFGSGTAPPPASSGLSYKYYEGDFNALPDFSMLTPVKTGTSANADISVRPAGVDDHFAFVWQGNINLPAAGTYTFETISDDGSKIYFNSAYAASTNSLVNNDGLHAATSATGTVTVQAAGAYPITITYFEKDGGQTMQLYWTGPGITRQPIPDAAFISGSTVSNGGLNYKYYEGSFDMLPDYTSLTPVRTGTTNNVDISIRPSGVNDNFAFIWDGYINLQAAGTYTFETISDDGSKVYFNMPYSVNGSSLVNNDGLHAPNNATGIVTVPSAGKYPITVTFFEKNGGETMQLYWTGPGITRQPVPDAAFTTTNSDNGAVVLSGTQAGNLSGDSNDGTATSAMPKVYPNPFVNNFTIDYYNSGSVKNKVSICIYDLNGKLIYTYQPATLLAGYNSWLINLQRSKLATGVYMTQLKLNGVPVKAIKIIKK